MQPEQGGRCDAARRFVILDRDGTLIVERNYLSRPADVELLAGAAEGLGRFEDLGWGRLVVTNQSGVNRGYFTRETVDAVHQRLEDLLAQSGASIDAVYFCPHTPEDNCGCRKPGAALVHQAAAEWAFDPSQCIFIGDKICDIEMGRRLGGLTMLVRTGYGEEALRTKHVPADYVVSDLKEAAEIAMKLDEDQSEEKPEEGKSGLFFRAHMLESLATRRRVLAECEASVAEAAAEIARGLACGGKLLLCGNGGSAADAQHIAGELVSVLSTDFPRQALSAIALTTNSSILTAIANDFGFGGVFERQVEALGRPGDVLIGITTSGNSENVVRALAAARKRSMRTIAMCGAAGGRALALADVAIRVPSGNVQQIQEVHISIGHILCAVVERILAAKDEVETGRPRLA